jgi:hypothetical protein
MANRAPTLRQRTVEIPLDRNDGGVTALNLVNDALVSIGIGNPVYWDLNDEDSDFDVPLYAEITDPWTTSFDRIIYTVGFSIMEAH